MQRVSNVHQSRWVTRQRATAATTGTRSSTRSRPALTRTEVRNTHHQCLMEAKGQGGQSAAEVSRALGTPKHYPHTCPNPWYLLKARQARVMMLQRGSICLSNPRGSWETAEITAE